LSSLQHASEGAERRSMQNSPCPDPMEHINTIGKVIGTITGAIGLFALIKKMWQNWREKHPTFKYTVIKSLEQIKAGQKRFEDFNAATLRERIGSIYNLYVLEMGWCPRAQKEKIALLFDIYVEYYGTDAEDPLIKHDKAIIMELPESKDQRIDYNQ